MKVVIDTNVFISSFFGGNPKRIINLWKEEKIILCLSKEILEEYVEVLSRMGFADEKELEKLLSLFAKGFNITFTSNTPKIKAVKDDPDDNKFIECAVACGAEFIITGDKTLEKIKKYQKIKILNPKNFMLSYKMCKV